MPQIAGSFGRGQQKAGGGQALTDLITFMGQMKLQQERFEEQKRHNLALEAADKVRNDALAGLYTLRADVLREELEEPEILRDVRGRLRERESGKPVFPNVEAGPSAEQKDIRKGRISAKDKEFNRLYRQSQNLVGVPLTDEEEIRMNQLRTDLRGMNKFDPVTGDPFMPSDTIAPFDASLQMYESPSGERIYWNGEQFISAE